MLQIKNHWLENVEKLYSPNFNDRPEETAVDLIVVHNIALPPGEYGGPYIAQLFTNQLDVTAHPHFHGLADLKVASHVVIYRNGHVQQFVAFDKRAWHAGVSSFQGRSNCNDFSIGIELEGSDNVPFQAVQYVQLASIIQSLLKYYPAITADRIVGHSDIAPDRKTDPGVNFDWNHLKDLLLREF